MKNLTSRVLQVRALIEILAMKHSAREVENSARGAALSKRNDIMYDTVTLDTEGCTGSISSSFCMNYSGIFWVRSLASGSE